MFVPGSVIVEQIVESLQTYLVQSAPKTNGKLLISQSNEEGEGEYKIFKWLNTLEVQNGTRLNAVVASVDSDVFLYSLLADANKFKFKFLRSDPMNFRAFDIDDLVHSIHSRITQQFQVKSDAGKSPVHDQPHSQP